MRLRQLAVDAVVWTGIRNWGSQASSFLVFLVLARLLPPEAFGLVAFAATLLAFAQIVINQGFALAIVQRERLDPEHIDTAFWTGIGLSLVLVAFVVGLAEPIAALAGEPELAPLLPWLSLGILLGSLSAVHVALLQRELRFRLLTLRTLVASTIGGLTGVAMALSGFGVWSLVGQQLTTMGVSVLVLWTSSDWRPGIRVSRTHFGDLFQFGISIVGSNIARFFARRSDRLLIGYLLGPAELGIYVIAFRTVDALIDLVNASLRQVAVPVFSRMQGDPTRLLRALYSATRTTSLVSFPAFAGLAALAPELVPALFGSQWEASIPIIRILAFHGIINSVQYNGAVVIAMGRPAWALAFSVAAALVTVTGILIAAPWGGIAVAGVIAVRGYVLYPFTVAVLRPLIQIRFGKLLGGYVVPAFGSAVVALIAIGITWTIGKHVSVYFTLATSTAAAALAYLLLIRVGAPDRYEAARELLVLALPSRLASKPKDAPEPREA
jgi:PST family polysaccharide transporter